MATLYEAETGHEIEVEPKNGTDFSLEELYELLHCQMIEVTNGLGRNTKRKR